MSSAVDKLKNVPVSIVKGLSVTIRHLVRTKTTQRYPEVMPRPMGQAPKVDPDDAFEFAYHISPRFRGLHGLTKDPETGDLNCIGCMACAKVCPDDLISMDLEKREGHSGRFPVTFTVNIGPCCFCGLCAEVCPTPMRAIVMTDAFEWASFERDGDNLVLNRDDLERLGEAEVARRAAGRTFGPNGELTSIVPEEEGNPYFQFAVESEKADRMKKDGEKPAREAPAPPAAAPAAASADPLAAVREAFAAAGLAVPEDLAAFDLDSLDSIEDRKLRGQCKSAIMKARKAAEAAAAAPEPAPTAEDPTAELRAAMEAVLAEAGIEPPADLAGFDLDRLDSIEDRKLRGRAKSSVRKLQRALGLLDEGAGD